MLAMALTAVWYGLSGALGCAKTISAPAYAVFRRAQQDDRAWRCAKTQRLRAWRTVWGYTALLEQRVFALLIGSTAFLT
jgi:hypothetical protein